jgi:hypothetical protein
LRVIKAAQRLGFTLEVADPLEVDRHRHGGRINTLRRRTRQTTEVVVEMTIPTVKVWR